MSHISKAKAKIKLKDKDILEQSLLSLKNVVILKDAYLYREIGFGRELDKSKGIFDYVIQDKKDKTLRVGLKKENDSYEIYYDDYGATGLFASKIVRKLNDWYIGYSTAKAIKQAAREKYEDYNIDVFEDEETGEIVVEAQENIL